MGAGGFAGSFQQFVDPGPRKLASAAEAPTAPEFEGIYRRVAPGAVSPRRASGGFNCVVEVGAAMARRLIASQIEAPSLSVPIAAEALREFVEQHRDELSQATQALAFDKRETYFLQVELGAPSALSFEAPHRVRIGFEGRVRLTEPEPPSMPPLQPPVGVAATDAPLAAQLADRRVVAELGQASLKLTCPYFAELEPRFVRCDVVASLRDASSKLRIPAGDGKLLVDSFAGPQAPTQLQQVMGALEVKLTPTISAVGHNPAGDPVREFTECATEVFHVERDGHQALAVAFDLMPGCHGVVEEVEDFLCGRDFGVVSDEWVVGQLLKSKWRLGGFYRQLNGDIGVRIKRDDREEDATVHFDFSLDGLTVASFETDANTRTDYLRLGGPATATPRFLRLQDGSVYGPDKVKLGEPVSEDWNVHTSPALEEALSSDWQLRTFQLQASHDAYRHLGRPFAHFPDHGVDVDYIRLEAVEKFIFCLGECRQVFQ